MPTEVLVSNQDEYDKDPELISSMMYRNVPIELIEIDHIGEVKITKHVMDPGYTIAVPRQTIHKLVERKLLGVFVHSVMSACMLMVNNDLDEE